MINPLSSISSLWANRQLSAQFTRREVEGRYKGSYLGIFWSFLTPMIMLALYTFVFGLVFKGSWPSPRGTNTIGDFALAMFAGQIAFQVVGEPVGRAATIITAVPNFVKKVIFPLEILPIVGVASALIHAMISLVILVIGSIWIYGGVPWTIILTPIVLVPNILLAVGLSWFLASLGVFLRDVGFITSVVMQCLFFASPVFYPVSAVPENYRWILMINPLTPSIESLRLVAINGQVPVMSDMLPSFFIGLIVACLGYVWFMQTRKGFADVL